MVFVYHLAEMFFVMASLQYIYCRSNPALMPVPEGRAIFDAWGLLAGIGMVAVFIVGFFILSWWTPFTAWLSGQIAYSVVPSRLRADNGPGVGFLATLAGLGCSVALFFV